jgi:hypothetical protein
MINTATRVRLIYGLVDPRTGCLRYVGRSLSGMRRPKQHAQPRIAQKRTHTGAWVRNLAADGLRPDIEILEVEPVDIVEAEQFWIAYFKSLGCNLTNLTIGGDGPCGYRHREETKRKISEAKKGTFPTPEHVEKNRLAQCGRKWTPETREKIVPKLRAPRPSGRKPKSEEHRRKIGEALRTSVAFKAYHAARAGRVAAFP